ncbi:hypothetical protein DFH09DRAFT_1075990 [Mycena vulgaris]|nr:hypothetical protein DFH09DRAFT_1075990 [Mycena vulgaris]
MAMTSDIDGTRALDLQGSRWRHLDSFSGGTRAGCLSSDSNIWDSQTPKYCTLPGRATLAASSASSASSRLGGGSSRPHPCLGYLTPTHLPRAQPSKVQCCTSESGDIRCRKAGVLKHKLVPLDEQKKEATHTGRGCNSLTGLSRVTSSTIRLGGGSGSSGFITAIEDPHIEPSTSLTPKMSGAQQVWVGILLEYLVQSPECPAY